MLAEACDMASSIPIGTRILSGWKYQVVRLRMVIYVIRFALSSYGWKTRTIRLLVQLYRRSKEYGYQLNRIIQHGDRYFMQLAVQGWPSQAYDRYLKHLFQCMEGSRVASLHSAIFAFTHSCGFQCEHCVEWDDLNKPDPLTANDVLQVLRKLHRAGVAQVLFSGGEPLNRYNDLLEVLKDAPTGMDYWLFTNGWKLTEERALAMKANGLTGVLVSMDHYEAEAHDRFRGTNGAFIRAVHGICSARNAGLLTGMTLVATSPFVNRVNLMRYMELAKGLGVSFVQFLEPETAGRYKGKDVQLSEEKQKLLEDVFLEMNGGRLYREYPLVTYYPYLKRKTGCAGAGHHFIYIDADGEVHPCPFCRQRSFSILQGDLQEQLTQLRSRGCSMLSPYVESTSNSGKAIQDL